MKNLKKFLIISLCLLCWNCSCDIQITDEIPMQAVDQEINPLSDGKKVSIPEFPQNDLQHENVNIPIPKTEAHEQNIDAKETIIQKKIFHPDPKIYKYSEQLRKMRRRGITTHNVYNRKFKAPITSSTHNVQEEPKAVNFSSEQETFLIQSTEANLSKDTAQETLIRQPSFEIPVEPTVSQSSSPDALEKVNSMKTETIDETNAQSQHSHSEAMPSFDEWKKMMLAEQEKSGQKIPSLNLPGKKIASQKRHRNYASYECGAKIVASNAEAEGTSRILNEQVDEYMLNPCKAKAWFVIELCETVQVAQIELANFELFSSCPKDFAVALSESFPTRDWFTVGVFTAAEQRVLQSFQLKAEGYKKFIKVELLSHYGKEHYCPLNVVRVFGTSMVDEYEEMEKMSDQHILPEDDIDRIDIPVEDKSSTNIFGSATDAVYNIVKKAAQVLGQHKSLDENAEKTIQQNMSENERCPVIDDSCTGEVNKTIPKSIISDSLVLPSTMHSSLYQHLRHCDECISSSHLSHSSIALPQCRFFQVAFGPVVYKSICDWFKYHYLLPLQNKSSHISSAQNQSHVEGIDSKSPPTIISVIIDQKSQAMPSYSDMSLSPVSGDTQETSELPPSYKSTDSYSTDKVTKPSIQPTRTFQNKEEGSHLDLTGTQVTKLSLENQISKPDSITDEYKIASSMNKPVTKIDDSHASVVITSSEAASLIVNITKETAEKLDLGVDDKALDLETGTIDVPVGDLQELKIADVSDTSTTKIDPVIVGSVSFSASQKESVFVRMSNRIKALELNMSLSSQYLQELSQRYRRQMEEMQRAFNKTIGTLNDTAKKAAERDLKQQEIIGNLQSQLLNLTTTVDQMMQKHVFLMAVEAIIMVTIMSLCVRRISSSIPAVAAPTPTSVITRRSRSDIKRRNSSGSCSPPSMKRVKKRSFSDESLHLVCHRGVLSNF